jgi:cyclase
MKRKAVWAIAALAVTFAAVPTANAQGGFGPPQLTRFDVADNIYTLRNATSGNSTMIVGEEGVILVDAKMPQDHDGMMELIREVTDAPVLYLINTHMHPDHVGGNPGIRGVGAHIIASENARRIMAERGQPGLPSLTFRDFMRVWLDDMPVDLHWFGRGHTDGDVIVHLPTRNLVIMGDLFALYGPYRAVIDYSAGASLAEWPETLERVLELEFDTVVPGHSGTTDRANIEGYIEYLRNTAEIVREMNAQGRSREDIQTVLQSEFNWGGLEMQIGLAGVIEELQ